MDESTSALDIETEKEVTNEIMNIKKDKTLIIIAHRLSTIEDSDLIYFLHKGKIIDSGTHNELIKNCKHYSQLYLHQRLTELN